MAREKAGAHGSPLVPIGIDYMQNDWVLLVTQDDTELETDREALSEAGFDTEYIVTAKADDAAHRLLGREGFERYKRPGLVIIDLDHTFGEGRSRLRRLVADLKEDADLRLIPVLLLMRENRMEDVNAWYQVGVNACAVRPDSHVSMVDFYRTVQTFWRERVLLPENDWP
jgi:two-component system, chemotaxis family, response regulator Rcp1